MSRAPARASSGAVVELHSASPEDTRELGAALGRVLASGDVVLLHGPLGAGKTAFTQGIGLGLGVTGTVNSPTFTILKEYEGRVPLYHFDLYRIEDPDELFDLGFEDYFAGAGASVVEWAERGEREGEAPVWGPDWLDIRIEPRGGDERAVLVSASGRRGAELRQAFLAAVGAQAEGYHP